MRAIALTLALFGLTVAAAAEQRTIYIVSFVDPAVPAFDGSVSEPKLATRALPSVRAKLLRGEAFDPDADDVLAYVDYLDRVHSRFADDARAELRRDARIRHRYRYAINGVALTLTASEAKSLRSLRGVAAVEQAPAYQLDTDAGPEFVGTAAVWSGQISGAPLQGEGRVLGVIDSGINATHPSFAAVAGAYTHSNPRGRFFGLCESNPTLCNAKLIGVYDFTDEGTGGIDANRHGTHVASTAVGNPISTAIQTSTGPIALQLSGVAPRASLISYKACVNDDASGTCNSADLLRAIEQTIVDQVDVVNYSIGGGPRDPWAAVGRPASDEMEAMLNARAAGVLYVVSAGNSGPSAATIRSPANAPWVLSVANQSHDRRFINALDSIGGVDPPPQLLGSGLTGGYGPAAIVHASSFGNALCGSGTFENPVNPFAPGTFTGQIVVCDRGIYARVDKSRFVREAGAGGFVLLNTAAEGESVVADNHSLPGTHLGFAHGELVRAWLARGGNRSARLNGGAARREATFGDRVASSSSRGPNPFAAEVLKPNLAAPGTDILAAIHTGSDIGSLSGTSMAAPHVSGAALLLKQARPTATPTIIASALVTSGDDSAMVEADGVTPANAYARGSGRLRVDRALRAGLYLQVDTSLFAAADPSRGGSPGSLNLPGAAIASCLERCSFSRTVTALVGGTWRAEPPADSGVRVLVTPTVFTLQAGQSQPLQIEVEAVDPEILGQQVSGALVFRADGGVAGDFRLPIQIYAEPGSFGDAFDLEVNAARGFSLLSFGQTTRFSKIAFGARAPTKGTTEAVNLDADSTRDDPYDSAGGGAITRLVELANDDVLIVETFGASFASEINLYVGVDSDSDGLAEESEERCRSANAGAFERCLLHVHTGGRWWVRMVNSTPLGPPGAAARLVTAVLPKRYDQTLVASGPGQVPAARTLFEVRLAHDLQGLSNDERWYSVLEVGADSASLGTVARVPVTLTGRLVNPTEQSYALIPGISHSLSIAGNQSLRRLALDVPRGTTQLRAVSSGNGNVDLFLIRQGTAASGFEIPPSPELATATLTSRGGDSSETLTLSGSDLTPGRWYVAVQNQGSARADITLTTTLEQTSGPPFWQGPWFNPDRSGHGVIVHRAGNGLFLVWYTFLEDGTPTWYSTSGPIDPNARSYSFPLGRFVWDGSRSVPTQVGWVNLAFITAEELFFAWHVNGSSGIERMVPLQATKDCPRVNGAPLDYTGAFVPVVDPGWGATPWTAANAEFMPFFVFDSRGQPRWVLDIQSPFGTEQFNLQQATGFCPTCNFRAVTGRPAGTLRRSYSSIDQMLVDLEVELQSPVEGSWVRLGAPLSRFVERLDCP